MSASVRQLRAERASAPNLKVVKAPRQRADLTPVDELRLAFKRRSRVAACVGVVFGGIIPLATFNTVHSEIDFSLPLYLQASAWFAVCGLVFSVITIYQWGVRIFGLRTKAAAFAVLLEGVMVTSHQPWLAWLVLALLMGVNAVALACNLVHPPKKTP